MNLCSWHLTPNLLTFRELDFSPASLLSPQRFHVILSRSRFNRLFWLNRLILVMANLAHILHMFCIDAVLISQDGSAGWFIVSGRCFGLHLHVCQLVLYLKTANGVRSRALARDMFLADPAERSDAEGK